MNKLIDKKDISEGSSNAEKQKFKSILKQKTVILKYNNILHYNIFYQNTKNEW